MAEGEPGRGRPAGAAGHAGISGGTAAGPAAAQARCRVVPAEAAPAPGTLDLIIFL